MITGKLYDWLKWLAQVFLPAFGALYVALAALWGFPEATAVAGTVLAVDTFLGVILGISQLSYGKATAGGEIHVTDTGEGLGYNLVLDDDPESLKDKREVRFKVRQLAAGSGKPLAKRKPRTRTPRHDEAPEG